MVDLLELVKLFALSSIDKLATFLLVIFISNKKLLMNIKQMVLFLITSFIFTLLVNYYGDLLGIFRMATKGVIGYIWFVISISLILKINLKSSILYVFVSFIIGMIGNLVAIALLFLIGVDKIDLNDSFQYTFGHTVTFITIYLIIFMLKGFKILSKFPKDLARKAFVNSILHVVLLLTIISVNITYFNYLSNDMIKGSTIIFNVFIFCILFFSLVLTNQNILKHKALLDELNKKNAQLEQMNEEQTAMNEELTALNEQLKDHMEVVEELAVTKERNRFARDIHDTLGHTLTMLVKMLEVTSIECDSTQPSVKNKIIEASDVAREGLKEVRRSISGLSPSKLSESSLKESLATLISDFKRTSSVDIHTSIEDADKIKNKVYSEVLYRACQEGLTNAVRHGKAKHIVILLRVDSSKIKLSIIDDGVGCKEIVKGFGTKGMEQRVHELNGTVSYSSDGENGFSVIVELPFAN